MKKILAIAPYAYLPYYSGGQRLIARFFHYLGQKTELTVAGVEKNDASLTETYRLLPLLKDGRSRYYDRSLVGKISSLITQEKFDLVIWEHPYYWWLARRVRRQTNVPCYIHTHNIEYQRFRSMGKWWWPILSRYERNAFRGANGVFFITPQDKQFAIGNWKIDPAKCIDLPYGIEDAATPTDRKLFRAQVGSSLSLDPNEKLLFFNGLLNYRPNLEALQIILDRINPLLLQRNDFRYKIIVCGKGLPEGMNNLEAYRNQNVVYAGFTDKIEMYYKAADVLMNPVLSGGGIKTKMVEAIGYGTTVVSTKTGAVGMDPACCGKKLVVVEDNDWNAFAAETIAACSVYEPTPSSYYERYYWPHIIHRLLADLPD